MVLVRALALILLLVPAGTRADDAAPPVLDALFPSGRETPELSELVRLAALPEGEDFRVVELGRDARTSHHAVAIRDREVPHRHDRHDLFVVLLRGHGAMQLGDEERPVGPGSLLYVPRGTPHAFRNATDLPAIAYAVYLPPFDGQDRVPVAAE